MQAQEFSQSVIPVPVEQKQLKLSRIRLMIQELSFELATLDKAIAADEQKCGIKDPGHFAYPCHLTAAQLRRKNLLRTVEGLKRCALLEKLAA